MDGNITGNSKLVGQLSGESHSLTGQMSGQSTLRGSVEKGIAIPYDYERLINKPKIESVELIGNRSLEEIGVDHISNAELAALLD